MGAQFPEKLLSLTVVLYLAATWSRGVRSDVVCLGQDVRFHLQRHLFLQNWSLYIGPRVFSCLFHIWF